MRSDQRPHHQRLPLFKTADDRLAELTELLIDRHSYEVPEIIAVPIEGGNPEYLDWVTESTRPAQ